MNNINYYFYKMTSDSGFAPNPFGGFCTLACCKPQIRKQAQKGDWVIGVLGAKALKCRGNIIFAMKVTEVLTFDEYYKDTRFSSKKPNKTNNKHGDNAYHKGPKGKWIQDPCYHTNKDKTITCKYIKADTKVNRVLISDHFFYFGIKSLTGPNKLFSNIKEKMKRVRSFRYKDMDKEGSDLVKFLHKHKKRNVIYGKPIHWHDPACNNQPDCGNQKLKGNFLEEG